MSMASLVKNFDDGLHKEAIRYKGPKGERLDAISYLTMKAEDEGVEPTAAEVKGSTDYWMRYLRVNPGELAREEKVKEFAYDVAVLEKLMGEVKLTPRGRWASTVDECIGKAFSTTTQQSIFPFFYSSQIQAGMLTMPLLDRIVFMTEQVQSNTAVHAEMAEITWERSTSVPIAEGARSPAVSIRSRERTVYLHKFMSRADITYEAARRQRLPLFARQIQRIGQQLQILLTNYVLDVTISGDGDSAAAGTTPAGTTGTPVYSDVVAGMLAFPQAYNPNLLIANGSGSLGKLLNMTEFKDPLAGFQFQNAGIYPNPLGMSLARWDVVTGEAPSAYATTTAVMMDDRISTVAYQEGGILTETDRVIDAQFEQVVTSLVFGAAVWDRQSARLLTGW